MSVLLVSTVSSEPFARRVAEALGVPLGGIDRQDFPDGEHYLRFDLGERLGLLNRDVVLVAATENSTNSDEVYRLGCAAVKNGARTLVLVIPYFGYSTMERATKPGEVVSAKTVARQLSAIPRAVRGTWVLLMDLHAAGIVHYFEGDLVALELYAEPKIVEAIRSLRLPKLCLASTDMGRAKWVEAFANRLDAPVALIHKKRLSGSETRISAVVGDVEGRNVVIYDDMIRTGGTLLNAARAYRDAGAGKLVAIATHGEMPGDALERLQSSGLFAAIACTNSHPRAVALRERGLIVRSVAELFCRFLR